MRELIATAHSWAGTLPMTRSCQAFGLSRATYDRWQEVEPQPNQDMALRAQVQEIALGRPAYG